MFVSICIFAISEAFEVTLWNRTMAETSGSVIYFYVLVFVKQFVNRYMECPGSFLDLVHIGIVSYLAA